MSMSGVPGVRVCPTNCSTDQQISFIADTTVSSRIELGVTCDWHSLGSVEDECMSALHAEARFVSSHSEGSELRSRTCRIYQTLRTSGRSPLSSELTPESILLSKICKIMHRLLSSFKRVEYMEAPMAAIGSHSADNVTSLRRSRGRGERTHHSRSHA